MLKTTTKLLVFCLAVTIGACAPKTQIPPAPVAPAPPQDEDLLQADALFNAREYLQALQAYEAYLTRNFDSPQAPAVLMKIGVIHRALAQYDQALVAYRRLIDQFGKSGFANDARIEILAVLYQQGKYLEVINQAPALIEALRDDIFLVRTYMILGDAFLAFEYPADAYEIYTLALQKADPLEAASVRAKLKNTLPTLTTDNILLLLGRIVDPVPRSHLMFALGLKRMEEETYEVALQDLTAFIEQYPDHEDAPRARDLITAIRDKSLYSRYNIGCLLPLSGPYKAYGQRAQKGIELALIQHNAQNDNRAVSVTIRDTASDPIKAVQAVRDLNNLQVAAILGPIISAEPAARAAQEKGIPIVTLTQKAGVPAVGDYVFRNFLTPRMQVTALVTHAVQTLGLKKFAVLYPKEPYGVTFMNLFWDEVLNQGGSVVGLESYQAGQTDFADAIKRLVGLYYEIPEDLEVFEALRREEIAALSGEEPVEEEPAVVEAEKEEKVAGRRTRDEDEPDPFIDFEAIFIPDAPKQAGLITPQLAYFDVVDVYMLGTNLWHSPTLIKMARQFVQGAILPNAFDNQDTAANVRRFVQAYEATFGEKPGFIEAIAYDSALLLFQTVSRDDIAFRSDIKTLLGTMPAFEGVTGLTTFDDTGDAVKALTLRQIEGRRFKEIE